MKHSTDRILTTFAGSLTRPPDLLEMVVFHHVLNFSPIWPILKPIEDVVAEVK